MLINTEQGDFNEFFSFWLEWDFSLQVCFEFLARTVHVVKILMQRLYPAWQLFSFLQSLSLCSCMFLFSPETHENIKSTFPIISKRPNIFSNSSQLKKRPTVKLLRCSSSISKYSGEFWILSKYYQGYIQNPRKMPFSWRKMHEEVSHWWTTLWMSPYPKQSPRQYYLTCVLYYWTTLFLSDHPNLKSYCSCNR